MKLDPHRKPTWYRAYSFALATAVLFVLAWLGQLVLQVRVVADDAAMHGHHFSWALFWPRFLASTLENWQAEFLQLLWQGIGFALFYHWGSSQSREQGQRLERKVDEVLRRLPDRQLRRDVRDDRR